MNFAQWLLVLPIPIIFFGCAIYSFKRRTRHLASEAIWWDIAMPFGLTATWLFLAILGWAILTEIAAFAERAAG